MNLLGGSTMCVEKENLILYSLIPNEIQEYWENLEIYKDCRKQALFLLGYLMGEIGRKQSSAQIKNKPILNKINYQGMNTDKLIRLSGDVLEKLRHNRLFKYKENEDVYSASQILLSENIDSWELSNQENVFYVLSGFAFSNYLGNKKIIEQYRNLREEKQKLIDNEHDDKLIEEWQIYMQSSDDEVKKGKHLKAIKELNKIEITKQEDIENV